MEVTIHRREEQAKTYLTYNMRVVLLSEHPSTLQLFLGRLSVCYALGAFEV